MWSDPMGQFVAFAALIIGVCGFLYSSRRVIRRKFENIGKEKRWCAFCRKNTPYLLNARAFCDSCGYRYDLWEERRE